MKSTILIKLFKSLEIHCTLYKCKTIGFLVNITEILQNNLKIFGEAVESSPQNHLDLIFLFETASQSFKC